MIFLHFKESEQLEFKKSTSELKEAIAGFKVVFFRPESKAGVNAGVNAGVKISALQRLIIDQIANDRQITAQKLSQLLKKDIRTVERNLVKLREKKVIERIGSDKSGHWVII